MGDEPRWIHVRHFFASLRVGRWRRGHSTGVSGCLGEESPRGDAVLVPGAMKSPRGAMITYEPRAHVTEADMVRA